ncbi:MAG: SDR family NAD(P)-dependent oxidoreductase [Paracoccaceae bacterium]
MTLQGKHALVTGGGTGIGLAIARALAAEGAQVTITGRRMKVLEDVATRGLHPLVMDVRNEDSVVTGIASAVAARGPIQICVPNAGIAEGKSLQKTTLDFWRNMVATNLDGVFLTIRESLKSMYETDWGRVISVSSVAGVRGLRGAPCYSATKHAVIGLTRSLSEDHLGGPITFNAICPGYVDTPIVDRNKVSIAQRAGISEDEALQMMVRANRHRRLIDPSEVSAAALWMVRPGSESINGQCIEIIGGQC